MNDLQDFKSELRAFIEFTYNASDKQNTAARINETEKAAFDFTDKYVLNSPDLIAGDLERPTQDILNEFITEKMQ
ncbi:hypothetical protein ACFSJW_13525 [Flavobacterium artemisiae]|uniref:Uncharacterized protein n=1 Tax=Flavobacterium artemisiae TaxID=2126556 RepID=A0ABW4HFS7_9FLAO